MPTKGREDGIELRRVARSVTLANQSNDIVNIMKAIGDYDQAKKEYGIKALSKRINPKHYDTCLDKAKQALVNV